MADSIPTETEDALESRVTIIERALKLDDRLSSLETTLKEKGYITNSPISWWKNSKTVTILAALIAAVVPLITVIDGTLKNNREYQKLLVDQQDKIRQVYLDRVLKAGITEVERQKIFSLLIKLKSDPELQEWAKEERDKVTQSIEELRKEKENLEQSYLKVTEELAEVKGSQGVEVRARLLGLTRQAANDKRRIDSIRERIGEPNNPSSNVDLPNFKELEISKSGSGSFLIQDAGRRIRLIPN